MPINRSSERAYAFRPGPRWKQIEDELLSVGIWLPLVHRLSWAEHSHQNKHCFVAVCDDQGRPLGGVAVQIDRCRVLPGHHYLRVVRFGESLPPSSLDPMVASLVRFARNDPGALRLSIGVFSPERRYEVGLSLEQYGFQKVDRPMSYRHTVMIDLRPEESEILKGLNKSARKNLHDADRSSLFVRTLTDPVYADRIASLQAAAMRRTKGSGARQEWDSILNLSRMNPGLSHVVGLFLSETDVTPDSMFGFAWGCMNGSYGEYRAGGSEQPPDRKIPISHCLVRDLMLWSKRQGASWFDMGGVTLGNSEDDPFRGITIFKRHFSHNVQEVGEEWALELHPARVSFARQLGYSIRSFADTVHRVRFGGRLDLSR